MATVNENMKDKRKFSGDGDNQANKRHGVVKKQKRKWIPEHKFRRGEGQGGFQDKGKFQRTGGKDHQANRGPGVNNQKRKWTPQHKQFEGSVGEGQGFAFKRKNKVQHEYNKLLRKERRKNTAVKTFYREEFPDHLSHLYKAEAEKLNTEAKMSQIKRTQCRMGIVVEEVIEEETTGDATTELATSTNGLGETGNPAGQTDPATKPLAVDSSVSIEKTDAPQTAAAAQTYSLPLSNRQKKKLDKKSSFQKMKEEFESAKEKRAQKKEAFLKDKQQREEAIEKYKKKKKEAFKVLNTKTKKGQPNFNVQMDYLLQKIQETAGK